MFKLDNNNNNLKYIFFLISYSYIFFVEHIYIHNINKELINIDNEYYMNLYENDINYMNSNSKFKPIAFYYPEYINISYNKYFNISFKKIIESNDILKIVIEQTKLAKNHHIYGFAIYYNPFKIDISSEIVLNTFINKVNFPFFLIWKNEEIKNIDNNIFDFLIFNFRKFMISDNYIKIDDRPILSIHNPYNITKSIYIISKLRKLAKSKIGKNLFLLYPFKGNYNKQKFIKSFDALYDFSKIDLFEEITNRPNILYYSGFIYKNLILNNIDLNFTIFRTCYLNYNNFKDYSPEKFYILNNIIFKSQKENFSIYKGFIFIDSWNDYLNGNYLEFDEKFGYSSINAFSKSLLNLSYQSNNFTFINKDRTLIAIHLHIFYEDLLDRIINRLNLIPFKYDLFISTTSNEKKIYIENYLINSNQTNYNIKIFENKGRDIYPFISQMRSHYKYYKYICHLHTKKSMHKQYLGSNWSEYIYNNLIGSRELISSIIYDFETNEKLGFIFPESYYEIVKGIKEFDNINLALNAMNKDFMNFILHRIFHKYKTGHKLIFPVGNMFWSKTKAIYQIFKLKLIYPDELSQINTTIMHAIERLWLYLVKLNGYYYKCIFKHY